MNKSAQQILFAGIFAFFMFPLYLSAAPVEVTFYPQSAQIKEVQKVRLKPINNNLRQAIITIPGQADPDTLATQLTSPASLNIMDQTWTQIIPQDDQGVVALRKKLAELKKEQNRLQAGIRALDTQIQFWQLQTKARVKTIADAGNMSNAIGKNIAKMVQDKLALEPQLEDISKKVKEIQDNLTQKAGKKETAWEVTVLLSGPAAAEATLTYTYTMSGCGWTSLYRLEAQPLKKRILFSWEAEIWQSSGQDWRQVNIRLATLQPSTTIAPQDLPPWVIKPHQEVVYKSKRRVMLEKMSDEAAELSAPAPNAMAAPQLSRESSFHVWNLGKRTLNAGIKQRVQVQEETWPVEFTHLARPSQSDQTFVRGSVQFQEDKEIPKGTASFMIDGALVGKRTFALSGREDIIYFGADPMIKASSVLQSQAAGEKSFFADKQTYRWEWRIEVVNGRAYGVRVRMEEPLPQSRDERINIAIKNSPEASEKSPTSQIWLLDIPAGEKKIVSTGVVVEAPKNLPLDLGWRR
ncbi:MAG: mucoidy inhibitor MuiA family protein [Syntrophales bacterium]